MHVRRILCNNLHNHSETQDGRARVGIAPTVLCHTEHDDVDDDDAAAALLLLWLTMMMVVVDDGANERVLCAHCRPQSTAATAVAVVVFEGEKCT